jgi:hypothetical protein
MLSKIKIGLLIYGTRSDFFSLPISNERVSDLKLF